MNNPQTTIGGGIIGSGFVIGVLIAASHKAPKSAVVLPYSLVATDIVTLGDGIHKSVENAADYAQANIELSKISVHGME